MITIMAKFNYKDLIEGIKPTDFQIPCDKNHNHLVAIVNAYDVDLYQSWTIEANDFFENKKKAKVLLVDIGIPLLHNQRSFFRELGTLLLRFALRHINLNKKRYLISYDKRLKSSKLILDVRNAIMSTIRILWANNLYRSRSISTPKDNSIFSTLATTFETVEFNVRRHPIKVFQLNLAFEICHRRIQTFCADVCPCLLVVGNGRLVKAAAIVESARKIETPVVIIERGAFPGTFDFYLNSPHSILERRMQATKLYSKHGLDTSKKIASSYIELRKEFDPVSGLKWHKNFVKGLIPVLDSRKVCVCFTSTETEFAVFGDKVNPVEFQSQEEAFRALASRLDPDEWQIIIRRHPYGNSSSKKDPESKLWTEVAKFPHVSFVGPGEAIDSYQLVREADLVAHYNSSMGPEAISMSCAPVLTMGPTLWETEYNPYVVRTLEELDNFLSRENPIRDEGDIGIWGLYWATFGYRFNLVEWQEGKGLVDGKRIL